jgi:hypothetical protein
MNAEPPCVRRRTRTKGRDSLDPSDAPGVLGNHGLVAGSARKSGGDSHGTSVNRSGRDRMTN